MRKAKIRNSAADTPLRIDLGCGDSKQAGYIGLDRFALPGVDIICDLDRGIPLKSDSVDYLLASHSLEHLRDLPAAIAEIFRVCKDRALITIVAPYDATRLNQANPYHLQAWNEHTARFFTTDAVYPGDADEVDFPSITAWGLGASDHSQWQVDLRCLRIQFQYFAPYRSLDEHTKKTLRQSMTDVCDQMALHLLVVKSVITREELSYLASTSQYRVTPAFEARELDEGTSSQNLFSELAQLPARFAAESTKAIEEIGQLGAEIRRFMRRLDQLDCAMVAQTQLSQSLTGRSDQLDRAMVAQAQEARNLVRRIDHLDRALVAETKETRESLSGLLSFGRSLGERLTAINSALTRRMQEAGAELRADLSAKLDAAAKQQSAQVALGNQIMLHLVAERRGRTDRAFWPIKYLRRYRQRRVDLRGEIGGEFALPWQGADAQQLGRFKLQRGLYLEAGVTRSYRLQVGASGLRSIDIGVLAMFPPVGPVVIADYELSHPSKGVISAGNLSVDHSCRAAPVRIDFENVACADGELALKLIPRASVEQIGIQVLEWHRVSRFLHRVLELRLAYRWVYEDAGA